MPPFRRFVNAARCAPHSRTAPGVGIGIGIDVGPEAAASPRMESAVDVDPGCNADGDPDAGRCSLLSACQGIDALRDVFARDAREIGGTGAGRIDPGNGFRKPDFNEAPSEVNRRFPRDNVDIVELASQRSEDIRLRDLAQQGREDHAVVVAGQEHSNRFKTALAGPTFPPYCLNRASQQSAAKEVDVQPESFPATLDA